MQQTALHVTSEPKVEHGPTSDRGVQPLDLSCCSPGKSKIWLFQCGLWAGPTFLYALSSQASAVAPCPIATRSQQTKTFGQSIQDRHSSSRFQPPAVRRGCREASFSRNCTKQSRNRWRMVRKRRCGYDFTIRETIGVITNATWICTSDNPNEWVKNWLLFGGPVCRAYHHFILAPCAKETSVEAPHCQGNMNSCSTKATMLLEDFETRAER